MTTPFTAVDLFCGGGFATEAMTQALDQLGITEYEALAVNHWREAIETHRQNHPTVVHLCESIENVNPQQRLFVDAVTGREFHNRGRFNLLLAGPECIFHSRARGGKPINDQRRSSAWRVIDWLTVNYVDNVLIENVVEFMDWAPLGSNGRPLKSRKGEIFKSYIGAIEAQDYDVEYRKIVAANYGDPTTRERLFIMARKRSRRKKIAWPEPTHSRAAARTLLRTTEKWRAAREIIDWSLPSRSIFDPTRKPIAPKTFQRILAGLAKFGGTEIEPFIVVLRNHADARSIDAPLPTIAANGGHMALAEPQPFIVTMEHQGSMRDIDLPLPTITTARGGAFAVIEPMVLAQGQGGAARPVSQPVPTVVGKGAHQLIEPFLVPHYGERPDPLPTVPATGGGKFEVCEPFIVPPRGFDQTGAKVDSVERPLRTITAVAGHNFGLVETAFVASYYGTKNISPVSAPLPTVTTKDRFALVMPVVNGRALDIHLRMLQPRELARAMSVRDSYSFAGNKGDQVKQIGNGWPRRTGTALIKALVKEYASTANVKLGAIA